MRTVNIREVAQVVRSKNAGPFRLTLNILFKERAVYEQALSTLRGIAHADLIPVHLPDPKPYTGVAGMVIGGKS